jgi:hypothetical protein
MLHNTSFRYTNPSAVTTFFYRLLFPNSRALISRFSQREVKQIYLELDSKDTFGLTLSAAGLATGTFMRQ